MVQTKTKADLFSGLTSSEARRLLARCGANEPVSQRRTAGIVQVLLLFANPLVIILLAASIISAALGEVINAFIIVVKRKPMRRLMG